VGQDGILPPIGNRRKVLTDILNSAQCLLPSSYYF
jgi:hypothetical protein